MSAYRRAHHTEDIDIRSTGEQRTVAALCVVHLNLLSVAVTGAASVTIYGRVTPTAPRVQIATGTGIVCTGLSVDAFSVVELDELGAEGAESTIHLLAKALEPWRHRT